MIHCFNYKPFELNDATIKVIQTVEKGFQISIIDHSYRYTSYFDIHLIHIFVHLENSTLSLSLTFSV